MRNLYLQLRDKHYFIDNEFLKKYCQVIERNTRTTIKSNTHKHHIIPKVWFKLVGEQVNNDLNNLVNLTCRDHLLAHYYLCLCTEDPFRYANQLALILLQSNKKINSVDKKLLKNLPMYNIIYEDYVAKNNSGYSLYEG